MDTAELILIITGSFIGSVLLFVLLTILWYRTQKKKFKQVLDDAEYKIRNAMDKIEMDGKNVEHEK